MAQKIRVSKAGFNAITETAPDNLIFSSDYNTFKYYAEGLVTITITVGGAGSYESTTNVAHNLGYRPMFMVEGRTEFATAGRYVVLPLGNHFSENVEAYCDTTNLTFYVNWGFSGAGSVTAKFYYKLFKNDIGI